MRNLRMFRKLCGDSTLKNVVVATNMWGEVDPWVGDAREAELMGEDIFFKPLIDGGAQVARHNNTLASAGNIIRLILDNHPLPLQIQAELVRDHKDISETSAGEELNRELNAQIMKNREEMRILKEEMEQEAKDKDERTRKEFEVETKRMQREIWRLENDIKRLTSDYKRERDRLEVQIEARGQEANRVAATYQQRIDELRDRHQANAVASEKDRAPLAEKINELTSKRDRAHADPVATWIEAMFDLSSVAKTIFDPFFDDDDALLFT